MSVLDCTAAARIRDRLGNNRTHFGMEASCRSNHFCHAMDPAVIGCAMPLLDEATRRF